MRSATLALAVALLAQAPPRGVAAPLGEDSAVAALASACVAGGTPLAAMTLNPAALGNLQRSQIRASIHSSWLDLWFARRGESREDLGRWVGGYGIEVGLRLGPGWLRAVRVGLGVHLPFRHLLRFEAPADSARPVFALYGDRAERTALLAALAAAPAPWLTIGLGAELGPALDTPTDVTWVGGNDPVRLVIDRDLRLTAAATGGVRLHPWPWLWFGAAWHEPLAIRSRGRNRTRAGPLVVDEPIEFVDVWEPRRAMAGVRVAPWRWLQIEFDADWAEWSKWVDAHGERPKPSWHDVWAVRAGAQLEASKVVTVRAGWAWEPSPVPAQEGERNELDATRNVVALGAQLDARAVWGIPLALDVHVRTHLLSTRSASKRPELLSDAAPERPGQQIANPGYPAWRAGGRVWDVGLTLSWGGPP